MKRAMRGILFTVVCFLCCNLAAKEKSYLDRNKILGQVKSMKTVRYEVKEKSGKPVRGYYVINNGLFFDRSGYLTEEHRYNEDGSLKSKKTIQYNAYGDQIKIRTQVSGGQIKNEGDFVYRYNASGKKVEEVKTAPDGKRKYRSEYRYDTSGNELEYRSYGTGNKVLYKNVKKYDKAGNMTEYVTYENDGVLVEQFTYEYDGKGRKVKENCLYFAYGKQFSKAAFKYNGSGQEIEQAWFDDKGRTISRWAYTYDTRGNRVREDKYSPDGKHLSRWTFQFDGKNNWTRKTEENFNENKVITERSFEYY